MNELVGTITTLSQTMTRTKKNFNELNNRIELQDKCTLLHHNSISAVVNTIQLLSKWVQDNNSDKSKLKKNTNNSIEDLQKLNNDKSNESSSSSITSPQPITTNNNNNNGDLSMNSVGEDA
jgi:hypothetical protein